MSNSNVNEEFVVEEKISLRDLHLMIRRIVGLKPVTNGTVFSIVKDLIEANSLEDGSNDMEHICHIVMEDRDSPYQAVPEDNLGGDISFQTGIMIDLTMALLKVEGVMEYLKRYHESMRISDGGRDSVSRFTNSFITDFFGGEDQIA